MTAVPARTLAIPRRVAVVLNRHARGVTERQIERMTRLHPAADVYVSSTLADSRLIARHLLERAYDVALLGGGDGTFVRCLADLEAEARRLRRPLPGLGVLRLGTGNALGYYLGASEPSESGLRADLQRALDRHARWRPLSLLRVGGVLAPFAGTGLDSQILEDYQATTRLLDRLGLGRVVSSPLRYALAVALRSVPRFVLRRLPEVEVRNVGSPAYQIGPDGQPDPTPLPSGTVLYRGRCTLAGAATIPCYGFGVRIFPFADLRQDRFHLRCTDASAAETLLHLPAVLRGSYRSPSIRDFLCDAVEITVEHPVPMQIGGDLLPERHDRLRIDLAERPVHVLSA
ncbi:MAG: hypothetical protein NZ890_13150 [Myxococcota bacterium]|nr:hypothetical protein [Myxococcota bacterium]